MKRAKKKEKKTIKAVTLLTRIEALLADVLDECAAIEKSMEKNVRSLLRAAESSIAAAKDYFIAPEPPKAMRKPVKRVVAKPKVKAKAPAKVKPAAKKRPVAAKRRAPMTVAVAKPEVLTTAPFVPPVPPATPPVITAH